MTKRQKRWIRLRIYIVAVVFQALLFVLLGRAYQLQILRREKLKALSDIYHKDILKIPPERGTIYDRQGYELAINIKTCSIYAHPHLIKKKGKVSKELSQILNIPYREIYRKLRRKTTYVWIKRKVAIDKAQRIKALKDRAIGLIYETKRFYPSGTVAGQVIGFSGIDNQGLEGIEKSLDSLLKGPSQRIIIMKDAKGRPFHISEPLSNKLGPYNVYLTIDKDIQYKAERVLADTVRKTKAKGGECIIMDPFSGQILAMAIVPPFNPNNFSRYSPSIWRNRAITDCFEPGSTIKPFLLAAALDSKAITLNEEFYCEKGLLRVTGHLIHDIRPYEYLTAKDIIVHSSNIGAIKIGRQLGYNNFYEYLKRFGFGSKTHIELIGERSGYIRAPDSARELDRVSAFFGQGLSVTSLQLAVAFSAIANGGTLLRPHIVYKITDRSGNLVKKTETDKIKRVLSDNVAELVKGILGEVVSEKGTARHASIFGYKVAGKTGTAQKIDPKTGTYYKERYISLFVGFAPIEHPHIVMLVKIDEPQGIHYGGLVAAPVFSNLGRWTLLYMGVSPSYIEHPIYPLLIAERERNNRTEKERESINGMLLPDFRGKTIREVLREAEGLGIKVWPEGSGYAVYQIPEPGIPLKEVSKVKVVFRPSIYGDL